MPKDCFDIRAYDRDEKLVFHQVYSTYGFYEDLHPIIDSNEFRVRHKVVKVEGIRYDDAGTVIQKWRATYADDGSFSEDQDLTR